MLGALWGAGPQLDLPHDATPKQLETLLNGLLAHGQDERLPYSFFVQEQQLAEELGAHLLRHKARAGHCRAALQWLWQRTCAQQAVVDHIPKVSPCCLDGGLLVHRGGLTIEHLDLDP